MLETIRRSPRTTNDFGLQSLLQGLMLETIPSSCRSCLPLQSHLQGLVLET